MGRPFIEFIQSQAVPWQDGLYGRGGAEVESKLLSLDEESGASSLLVRYPAGYAREEGVHHMEVDEEFLVLHGALTISGVEYGKYSYGHFPAGTVTSGVESRSGAVVLTFFSGEPRLREGDAPAGMLDERRLVTKVDGFAGEWGGNFHPTFPPGAGRKFLRRDPVDGEETWLLGTMPLRSGRKPEKHPVVEEMYLLAGELAGPLGLMRAGCYFWRPPEEWHGPFGSPTGNLMLFRTKGGPLSTVYTEHDVDFTWTPEHRPILPPELAVHGAEPLPEQPGCLCF
ncbi:cupin domain-containing protein [Actinomadura geliboluensis]|uniref:cupin domain-containing protein n=1 Tax=Actinomadura geliboluensis TaxID=882440 RepID=UPI0036789E03